LETKRILFVGEGPNVPSSLGKVMLYLTMTLAELGHEVVVVPHSGAAYPTTFAFKRKFNPRREAESGGSVLADLLPDVDIEIIPWAKAYPFRDALAMAGAVDVAVFYIYPYLDQDLNKIAHEELNAKGIPSIVYALHEGPWLDAAAAATVLAYSAVTAPTRFVLELYMRGLAEACDVTKSECDAGTFVERFHVLYHPLDTKIYSPRTLELVVKAMPERTDTRSKCRHVVGMIGKNHIRKDFGLLVRAVARLRARGVDACAAAFIIDHLGHGYWNLDSLVEFCLRKYGVRMDDYVFRTPDHIRMMGATEESLLRLYSYMDLHLFASRGEAFGLPPVESVLLGIPTITTALPPQQEVFSLTDVPMIPADLSMIDGANIEWVPDEDAAVELAQYWLGNLDELRKVTLRARDVLVQRVDRFEVAKRFLEIAERAQRDPRPLSEFLRIPIAEVRR